MKRDTVIKERLLNIDIYLLLCMHCIYNIHVYYIMLAGWKCSNSSLCSDTELYKESMLPQGWQIEKITRKKVKHNKLNSNKFFVLRHLWKLRTFTCRWLVAKRNLKKIQQVEFFQHLRKAGAFSVFSNQGFM